MSTDPDVEVVLVDSTICKSPADATGGGGTQDHGIGRSRRGLTTGIHAAVDALGLPVRVIPAAEQRGECPQAAARLGGLEDVGQVITEAAHDPEPLRETIEEDRGAEAHLQARPSPAIKPFFDPHLHAERQKVENVLQRFQRFRRTVRRYEKPLTSFGGFVFIVAARDWLR